MPDRECAGSGELTTSVDGRQPCARRGRGERPPDVTPAPSRVRYSADAKMSPMTSLPRSRRPARAAAAIARRSCRACPISAARPPRARRALGSRPPIATRAALHVPSCDRHDAPRRRPRRSARPDARTSRTPIPARAPCRHLDRRQDLVVGQRRRHDAREELVRRDRALAAPGRARDDAGVERDEHGRQVGRRIGVRDVAADRSAVPDRRDRRPSPPLRRAPAPRRADPPTRPARRAS